MDAVGTDVAKGVRKFQVAASGTDSEMLQEMMRTVIDAGKGAGDKKNVGRTYYNIGVGSMAIAAEAARLAMEEYGAPLTGEKLAKGFEKIEDFDAKGLMAPVTITNKDHRSEERRVGKECRSEEQ